MISFRYHVVTIVAVFLALAIGLLGGGAFVQPALQRELENRTDALRRTNAALREQIEELHAQTAAMAAFSDAALPYLTRDRLVGSRIVIVTQQGVGDTVLGETQRALADAGAEVIAILTARDAIATTDADASAELAEIIGHPTALSVDLPSLTANALAERLSTRPTPADDGAVADDLLAGLLTAGFLTVDEGTPLDSIGGAEQIVVVLGGGPTEEPAMLPSEFASPLVARLSELGIRVAAGEGSDTPPGVSLVADVRDGVGDTVVSVDDLELSMGGAALVLGIDTLVTTGEGGAYGFGDGADPLPALP